MPLSQVKGSVYLSFCSFLSFQSIPMMLDSWAMREELCIPGMISTYDRICLQNPRGLRLIPPSSPLGLELFIREGPSARLFICLLFPRDFLFLTTSLYLPKHPLLKSQIRLIKTISKKTHFYYYSYYSYYFLFLYT